MKGEHSSFLSSVSIVPDIFPNKGSMFANPAGDTLPQTNMETNIAPFKRTVVFIGPFWGFHVSFREGIYCSSCNPKP